MGVTTMKTQRKYRKLPENNKLGTIVKLHETYQKISKTFI